MSFSFGRIYVFYLRDARETSELHPFRGRETCRIRISLTRNERSVQPAGPKGVGNKTARLVFSTSPRALLPKMPGKRNRLPQLAICGGHCGSETAERLNSACLAMAYTFSYNYFQRDILYCPQRHGRVFLLEWVRCAMWGSDWICSRYRLICDFVYRAMH